MKSQYGRMFWLLFMNDPFDPEITDFDLQKVRKYLKEGDKLVFDEDSRDEKLAKKLEVSDAPARAAEGLPLNSQTYDSLFPSGQREYLANKWKEMKR